MARKSSSSNDHAELFRADLISAMKLSDLRQLQPGSYYTIKEPWRKEWEIGVQVCTNPTSLPVASTEIISDPPVYPGAFELPQNMICKDNSSPTYYCDDTDLCWLESVNKQKLKAISKAQAITPEDLQRAFVAFELKCQRNMANAIATEEDFAIQYNDTIVCDVCKEKDGEEANEMIFCDSCNICVHQACYGVTSIPQLTWLCRPCLEYDTSAQCVLCPNEGGALKKTQYGCKWVHVTCALWIPEVGIGNIEKMEPITKVEDIPSKRLSLVCCICKKKQGACIQCSAENCLVSYHVTCGFKVGLEMKSKLELGVFSESYCPRHTAMRRPGSCRSQFTLEAKKPIKSARLQEMEDEFYTYVSSNEVASELGIQPQCCELFYNYWKLKRKANYNHPLLCASDVKDVIEEIKEDLLQKSKKDAECYQVFMKLVRIRQDLEKSRNLSYMTQRREQLKRQQIIVEKQITAEELAILNATPISEPTAIIPQRKRGRPRKNVLDNMQPAAKMPKITEEIKSEEKHEETMLIKHPVVSLPEYPRPNHANITQITAEELAILNATPIPEPTAIIPRRKRGRPRKKVLDNLQPAAKMPEITEEIKLEKHEETSLVKHPVVSLPQYPIPNHANITQITTEKLAILNATPIPEPIPRRKRGRPRKKVYDNLQPAAKITEEEINSEDKHEEITLEKHPVVSLPQYPRPNHANITNPLDNTFKDENKAKSTGIDCQVKVKKVSVALQRYPLRKNGHVLCESKPVLNCKNNVLLQKKQPVVVIKKCHELQRLYNVSFSCKGKINQHADTYYLRNGWKQEFLPR